MLLAPSVDLSGRQAGWQHGGPLDGRLQFHASPLLGGDLKGLHGLEGVQRERAAGSMWSTRHNRRSQIGDADGPKFAVDIAVSVRNRLPIAARLRHRDLAAKPVG